MENVELKILIALHRVSDALDAKTAKLAKEHDLSLGQFAVLEALLHKGELTVGEVKEKILSSSGTIPVIISNLEKKKLLRRRPDHRDARRTLLSLTEKGRRLIMEIFPKNEQIIMESMAMLDGNEKEALLGTLKKLGERE